MNAIFAAILLATQALPPIVWKGGADCWQMQRHAKKLVEATNKVHDVVFIGDSITHGWESAGKTQWNKYFAGAPYNALNLGYSADRVEHVLWRITEGRELDGYTTKCVLLMIGVNNSSGPIIDVIGSIRDILKVIREKQPKAKIVLTAIFPFGEKADNPRRIRNMKINREIANFCDGKTIFWCDFCDQLLTSDGRYPKDVAPDCLHPNGYGYEVWAAAVKPYIDYALADGRLPAPPNRYAPYVHSEVFRLEGSTAERPASRIGDEGYAWWLDRMLRNREVIRKSGGNVDLVFLGDSITHGWERHAQSVIAEITNTYSLVSAGYGADRTENVLWRIENGELSGYKAKLITLMIGTNNTWHRKDKPEDIANGIKLILSKIAELQPQAKTLLMPIFPFGNGPNHPNRVNNEKVNQIIKSFADGERVIWLDFNDKLVDEKGDMIKYAKDRCHPNLIAYRDIWWPAILPYAKKFCGK